MNSIKINKLNAGYGQSQVLYDISLEVKEGLVVSLLGPNGSGKSTLLKSIFGLTAIYNGSIKFNEKDITKKEPYEIAKLGLVYLPQVGSIFERLTVRENLVMAGYIYSEGERNTRIREVLRSYPKLKHYLERKVNLLSGGERQTVGIAMALIREPVFIMFDEPGASLAARIVDEVFEKIKELNKTKNMTILLVEQNIKKALEVSDYVYLLAAGRINFHGAPKKLMEHPEFGKLFLGLK